MLSSLNRRSGLSIHPSLPETFLNLSQQRQNDPFGSKFAALADTLAQRLTGSCPTGCRSIAKEAIIEARTTLGQSLAGLRSYTYSGPDLSRERERLYQILKIRDDAWKESGINKTCLEDWLDNIDLMPATLHNILLRHGIPIAAGRVTVHTSVETLQDGQYYYPYTTELPPPIAQISRLAVLPDFQRNGFGLHFLSWAEVKAKQQGASCVTLDVKAKNDNEWLEKLGYQILGETGPQEGYPENLNWIVIRKNLRNSEHHNSEQKA